MTNVFFGFGHGFGGTHLLSVLLSFLPNVDCKHERRDALSKHAMFDKFMNVFHGDVEAGNKAILEERLLMVQSVINNNKIFGEINGILGFFITALFKIWPKAKFIYTMRDPKTQIITTHNTGIFNENVAKQILKSHPEWNSVWWWPLPSGKDPIKKKWSNLSSYEKCAWFWSAYNEFVLVQLKTIPSEQVFYYKFEDMTKGLKINELYDFLGLKRPTAEQVRNVVSKKHAKTCTRVSNVVPVWENQSKEQQQLILTLIKNTMVKLSY